MGPLRILEVEIDNFKTFRQEKITFLPGFTAISGPNGSGKSNILDALLFALGLGNNRALRAERVNDLINNSSPRREARVTVRFGTGSRTHGAAGEGAEGEDEILEIARRVRESTPTAGGPPTPVSTYYLNGKVATKEDVHDALARHRISPNGYNVVMQGDVTSIIRMSATERRKIIDEVAGVADFDHRIEQATKELTAVVEQEDRTGLLLGEIDQRLGALRAERDQALAYRALEQELKGYEAVARHAAWWDQKDAIAGLEAVLAASTAKQGELVDALELARRALDAARAQEAVLAQAIRDQGGERLEALEERCRKLETDQEKARLEEEAARRRAAELQTAADHDAERMARHEARMADLAKDALAKAAEKQSLEAQAVELRQEHDRLQQELEELTAGRQEVKAQEDALRARLDAAQKALSQLEIEKIQARAQRVTVEDRLEASKTARARHAEEARAADAEVERLTQGAEHARGQAQMAQSDQERAAGHLQRLEQSLAEAEAQNKAAREAFQLAQSRIEAQSSAFRGDLDMVLHAQIPGVVGTLLQLGEADPKFARALQEAGGGRLKAIVTEDDGAAAKALNLVKRQGHGRITCFPLNKLQPARRLPPVKAAGCLGYAIEKIAFEARYAAAFSLVFGDTLIFETLDAARPYIGQYRMVTLDGEIMDKSGSMTGGRVKQEPAQFQANLQKDFDEKKAAFENAAQRVARQQAALSEMKAAVSSARERREKSEEDAAAADRDRLSAVRTASESRERLVQDDEAIRRDQTELAQVADRFESLIEAGLPHEMEMADAEMALAELTDSIGDTHVTELSEAVQQVRWKANDAINAAASAQDALDDMDRRRADEQADRQVAADERARHFTERDGALAEAEAAAKLQVALGQELVAAEVERRQAREQLGKLGAERDEAVQATSRAQVELNNRQRDVEGFEAGLHHTRERLAEQVRNLQDMENRLWEAGIELPSERPQMSTHQVEAARKQAQGRIEALGPVNQLAIEQYDREEGRAGELREKRESLKSEREQIEARMDEIGSQKKAVFMGVFDQVQGTFGEIFQELAAGSGELSLEDPADPFNGGLIIRAQPPGSRVFRLEAMSGGEKSLTALAFLFAIQRTQPAPFYALDEVDHALDGVNDERLARMIKRQADNAQMVVISHRKPMIGHSDQAIGVYARPDGTTRITAVRWGNSRGEAEPEVVPA